MVATVHAFRLVGPWYRWKRAAMPEDGRTSPPALQKFAGGDFIQRFLADPQHSLQFDAEIDVVSGLDVAGVATRWIARIAARLPFDVKLAPPAKVKPPTLSGTAAVLAGIRAARPAPSAMRKLFRPEHDRHYLVVCELHCDMPGLPTVAREQVCQAGFVLRRRSLDIPANLRAQAAQLTADCTAREAALAEFEALAEPAPPAVSSRSEEVQRVIKENANRVARREALRLAAGFASFAAMLAARRAEVATLREALPRLLADNKVNGQIEGWFARDPGSPPRWNGLSEEEEFGDTPHGLHEQFFPLTPLVPDPRLPNHDAAGRTIYFGVVPTVLPDHDPDGQARVDDKSTYEIRCFVRRHDPDRLRAAGDPDCCGEVVWSKSTEPFRIAPPFDLIGTAQRPVTIQMPDLAELAAQVAARPRGKLSPVKFVQPQHMSPISQTAGALDGPAICFFSIPLITIVALFLLNLFLPIVVLIFQLWFLLALRFCIKPQLKVEAGLDAAIAAVPPGVDLAADASIGVIGMPKVLDRLRKAISDDAHIDPAELGDARISGDVKAGLGQAYADAALLPDDPEDAPAGLGYIEELEYEPHRDAEWRRTAGGRG